MTTTPELIDTLVACATPVRRLRPPLVRAGLWLLFAALSSGSSPSLMVYGPIFSERCSSRSLSSPCLARLRPASWRQSLLPVSLPDSSRLWLLLPLPALVFGYRPLAMAASLIGSAVGPDGVRIGEAVRCFATLLLTSVPLSIAMLVMLRYAACCADGGQPDGRTGRCRNNPFALSLFHDLDATMMILMWNLGTAAILATLSAVFGKFVLASTAARLMPTLEASTTKP